VKVTALEVPLAVLIATCAEGVADGGTVTLQVFGAGQLVVATWPLNVATIWPLELRKLDPATTMACPTGPLAGESEEMTGGPPAAAATVVEVVVPCAPPFPGRVDDGGDGTVLGDATVLPAVPAAVGDGGDGRLVTDATSALAATTTRAAATATDPISQRSARPGRRPFPDGVTASGGWARDGGAVGGNGAPLPAARARRTAFSIAPRAR
jgi:hypothetical protein